MSYLIANADAVNPPVAERSVDLVIGSPPYCDARSYGIGADRGCADWVSWMLRVTDAWVARCKGPVIWVAAGVTRSRSYWPACEGLMWMWYMRGGSAYRPCYWHKSASIPGSGGDQWFRSDVEYCMCFKRPGPLPWTDNTAMGHPPKWGPGGEMSHRLSDGTRVNQYGGTQKRQHTRRKHGHRQDAHRPGHRFVKPRQTKRKHGDGEVQDYEPPTLANPGNLIRTNVGKGHMGDNIAHENEAPFPESLVEWFVLSLCPPGGIVVDPFSGSGTTAKVARRFDRHAIALDLRVSECEKAQRRLSCVQKELFV